jgi:hypothetical protein
VRVGAVILDSERFRARPNDADWNDAALRKHNAAWQIARETFPEARIEWYGRGNVHRVAGGTGWAPARFLTLKEKGQAFSCSLYSVPEIIHMREVFRRTHELARRHGVSEVTPWVALGSGYQRRMNVFREFTQAWDYDVIYSWLLGAEINNSWFGDRPQRFAPWNAAKVVILYPGPFDPDTPHWNKHFIAYARGATDPRNKARRDTPLAAPNTLKEKTSGEDE